MCGSTPGYYKSNGIYYFKYCSRRAKSNAQSSVDVDFEVETIPHISKFLIRQVRTPQPPHGAHLRFDPPLNIDRAEASSPLLDVDYAEEGRSEFEDFGTEPSIYDQIHS